MGEWELSAFVGGLCVCVGGRGAVYVRDAVRVCCEGCVWGGASVCMGRRWMCVREGCVCVL